jgi:hypothetical protein
MTALGQGTAFTYQGRLNDGSNPAHGVYDLRFKLFEDPAGNNQAGSTLLTNGVPLTDGLFTVTLNFGPGIFNGSNYWLEVDVRTNGAVGYANLNPLQPIMPAPYAMFANTASNLSGPISSMDLSGTYGSPVVVSNSQNSFGGTFAGNGANVTNVNAATLNGLGAGNFWQLGGNAGTGPANFVGSTDNQPLELRANGARALRIEPNTNGAPNVIGGGANNFVDPGIVGATIAGGGATNLSGYFQATSISNHVGAIFATVGGGRGNTANADHTTVGGGLGNTLQSGADDSFIGGGYGNTVASNAFRAVIVGGSANLNAGSYSALVGGANNSMGASGSYGFIGGGYGNTNAGFLAVIGGGEYNSIQSGGYQATIGGGYGNTNSGQYATIPGGYLNLAAGYYSFAAGRQAEANHYGAFVWADSQGVDFPSSVPNEFAVRAGGGVRFVTGGAGMTVDGKSVGAQSGNFVFAFNNSAQAVASANVYQDITFSVDAQIDGWQHTPGTSQYTNAQSGLYLVQYNAQVITTSGNGTNAQVRVMLNSVEIPGTHATATVSSLSEAASVSRSFIASFNASDILTLQLTGSGTGIRLFGTPGISLTITRLQ